MTVRSPKEILFRLRQESRNLWMLARPPQGAPEMKRSCLLPPVSPIVDRIRGTEFADGIVAIAEQILQHRFPLLGCVVETGPKISWRRDYQRGIETGLDYFRRIPYLDVSRAGDHKIVWELNRHQHLVILAQAYLLTGRAAFLNELAAQLASWMDDNPFLRGINWASSLEAAFRALSWIWVLHLVGEKLEPTIARRVRVALHQHGCFIENNLSIYFSPNTHLLGEAVALHALGRVFSHSYWENAGARQVENEIQRQLHPDGSHFEQSSYYHVYALDMLIFHFIIARTDCDGALTRMAEYLAALLGPAHTLPFLGDDDGGRFFHPYGERNRFARATLATCGVLLDRPEWIGDPRDILEQALWWLGPERMPASSGAPLPHKSHLFSDTGIAVMICGDRQVIVDGGPFGPGRAGHSHSDTLGVLVRAGEREILIDPGTYTYVGDSKWRDWFRGSSAHNTIQIDKRSQAMPMRPFWWADLPRVQVREWVTTAEHDFFDAACRYRDIVHRRRVLWIKPDIVVIFDEVQGSPGEHLIEQFWHLENNALATLALEDTPLREEGWRSPVFGQKLSAPVLCVTRKQPLPCFLAAAIVFGAPQQVTLNHLADGEQHRINLQGPVQVEVTISPSGIPSYRLEAALPRNSS